MSFPDGWNRKCVLTIDANEVDATLTDFPVLFTESNLPSEMFDSDGSNPAQNGGGDIRFSSDSAATTQLPCEVVSFVADNDPANGEAQIWVKVSSISSSSDTTIYIWYNTSGTESQPAVTDTYGRNAVWSEFEAVYHLEEDPSGTAPQGVNSEGTSSQDLTTAGSMASGDLVTGKVGNAWDFDGSDDSGDSNSDLSNFIDAAEGHIEAWFYPRANPSEDTRSYAGMGVAAESAGYAGILFSRISGTNYIAAYNWDGTEDRVLSSANPSLNTWHHATWKHESSNLELYVNGVSVGTVGSNNTQITTGDVLVGLGYVSSQEFDGLIDEVRWSKTAKSDAWVAASYSTQNTPNTFASAGTPENTIEALLAINDSIASRININLPFSRAFPTSGTNTLFDKQGKTMLAMVGTILAGRDQEILYNTNATGIVVVGNSVQILYNVKEVSGNSQELLFDVIQISGNSKEITYETRQLSGLVGEFLYNTKQEIGNNQQMLFNVLETSGRSQEKLWNIRQLSGNSQESLWNVREVIGKSNESSWNLRQQSGLSQEMLYDVLSTLVTVGNSANMAWNLRQLSGKQRKALWNTIASVGVNFYDFDLSITQAEFFNLSIAQMESFILSIRDEYSI